MNIKQLRYFSAIAQEGKITRAAKKLHMAQPPLSQQLKLLEEKRGVLLIGRNGGNFKLIDTGYSPGAEINVFYNYSNKK